VGPLRRSSFLWLPQGELECRSDHLRIRQAASERPVPALRPAVIRAAHSATRTRRPAIPTLHFLRVVYLSPEDEAAFFAWLERIPGVREVRGFGPCLHVSIPSKPSQACLRELEAIAQRYRVSPTLTSSRQACPSPSVSVAGATRRRQEQRGVSSHNIPPVHFRRGIRRSHRPT
jgi:hypothetical protein